ncbi:uncharacterized protein LOC128921478 [Zeugodacus cucurbitae]|uniref:Thiamine-phosphate synthase n=1 Tax=Zeugodacus cucurbitae TaxID=28588 RepID=A0A0A1WZU2_ZEUCU|nr:uncharacterized protein LOC128921478 [Zeugodacus cucurbitae]
MSCLLNFDAVNQLMGKLRLFFWCKANSSHISQEEILTDVAKSTLIPTAFVKLEHDGNLHEIRVMINTSRKVTAIAEELVQKLKLPITYVKSSPIYKITIRSKTDPDWTIEINSVSRNELPKQPYDDNRSGEIVNEFDHLPLADPHFYNTAKVMMELGADVYSRLIKPEFFKSQNGNFIAQDTALGFIVTGTNEV